MTWMNRLTGNKSSRPQAPLVPGQWAYAGSAPIPIRDTHAEPDDLLLPDHDGRFRSADLGALRTHPHLSADEDAYRSLRLIGDQLGALDVADWNAWTAQTPLVPALSDALDETLLERQLRAGLGYLEAVCQKPRAHLKYEEKRQLVSRCKRPSVRAAQVLAARSEDWERRTLWGVRPRRVLGMVRDELFDIYENRVAVTLVGHLETALRGRLRAVRRIAQLLRQKENYQEVLNGSLNYQRALRVLSLWADALGDKAQLAKTEAALRRLSRLLRRVLALRDSLLYRRIGETSGKRVQLRMTNVLSCDETYRHVAELWLAWEAHMRQVTLDPDVRWRQEQDAAHGFERFVLLLVIRTLDALGFSPVPPPDKDGSWELAGPGPSLRLYHSQHDITVQTPDWGTLLRFVSLPAMLAGSATTERWLGTLPKDTHLAVVYLPTDKPHASPQAKLRLESLGNLGEGGPMFIAAAPWDLESVERVARALRWSIWTALYDRYPFGAPTPTDWSAPEGPMPPWLVHDGGHLNVVRPPSAHDKAWESHRRQTESRAKAVAQVKAKLAACGPNENRKRLHLKAKFEGLDALHGANLAVEEGLRKATMLTRTLLTCPVCREQANPHSFEQTGSLFRCECPSCSAVWGRRTCAGCTEAFAFIDFIGNEPSQELLGADRRYGADVLALPVDEDVFVCPHCGLRSDGEPHG